MPSKRCSVNSPSRRDSHGGARRVGEGVTDIPEERERPRLKTGQPKCQREGLSAMGEGEEGE